MERRFEFGRNWLRFSNRLTENDVEAAVESLKQVLPGNLDGSSFLDAGCGSGLFSLAARRLGAEVVSFDFDSDSVRCTEEVRSRFVGNDPNWRIERGSVLDEEYLKSLGEFDVVYSWGVLHHTGNLWRALEDILRSVKPAGVFFVSIYNDQGMLSRYWTAVKRLYNSGRVGRTVVVATHLPYLLARLIVRGITGRLTFERGMSAWFDLIDWLGGYPFETASPEQVFEFCASKGFRLTYLKTCRGRHGCNEFVFERQ